MTALGIVTCYVMGRSLAWNWLSLGALIFLVPFTFGLYYIPESPPWLVYNDEEDLAFKSMSQIRGEEYDATCEIEHFKVRQDLPEQNILSFGNCLYYPSRSLQSILAAFFSFKKYIFWAGGPPNLDFAQKKGCLLLGFLPLE